MFVTVTTKNEIISMPQKAIITPGRIVDYSGKTLWRRDNSDDQNPYEVEHARLYDAIRNDKPYNEVDRGVRASLVSSMGRMAAHTGQVITYDQILNNDHEFAPGIENFRMDSPAPVLADATGHYPVPSPGLNKKREY